MELPLFATPYSPFAPYIRSLRLTAGILAGLRHLRPRVGRHHPDIIEQRHELESHIDGAGRTCRTTAVNARIEAALAAFLDDLFVDLENFRFIAVELRHQTVGEAEVGRADIDAVDALDIEDRFHVFNGGSCLPPPPPHHPPLCRLPL